MKSLIVFAFLAAASALQPELQKPSFLPLVLSREFVEEAQGVKVVESPETPMAVNFVDQPIDAPVKTFEPLRPSELESLYVEIPEAPPRRPTIVYDNPMWRGADSQFDAPQGRPGKVYDNPMLRGADPQFDAPQGRPGKVYNNPYWRGGH